MLWFYVLFLISLSEIFQYSNWKSRKNWNENECEKARQKNSCRCFKTQHCTVIKSLHTPTHLHLFVHVVCVVTYITYKHK